MDVLLIEESVEGIYVMKLNGFYVYIYTIFASLKFFGNVHIKGKAMPKPL